MDSANYPPWGQWLITSYVPLGKMFTSPMSCHVFSGWRSSIALKLINLTSIQTDKCAQRNCAESLDYYDKLQQGTQTFSSAVADRGAAMPVDSCRPHTIICPLNFIDKQHDLTQSCKMPGLRLWLWKPGMGFLFPSHGALVYNGLYRRAQNLTEGSLLYNGLYRRARGAKICHISLSL